ncbi:uncharacterized protein LOC144791170 [Lissotriton helveticus]
MSRPLNKERDRDGVRAKMSSKKTGFKPCGECGKIMSITDSHEDCVWCLSSDHDVQGCPCCKKMNPKALCEREVKLLVAKMKGKKDRKSSKSRSRRSRSRSRSTSRSSSGHASRSTKNKHKKRKHGSQHHSGKDSDSRPKSPGRRHHKDDVSPLPDVLDPEADGKRIPTCTWLSCNIPSARRFKRGNQQIVYQQEPVRKAADRVTKPTTEELSRMIIHRCKRNSTNSLTKGTREKLIRNVILRCERNSTGALSTGTKK